MPGLSLGPIGNQFDFEVVWVVVKWMYVLGSSLFVIFGIVVVAQVKQMVGTLRSKFHSVLVLLAAGYLALTVGAWWLTLTLL